MQGNLFKARAEAIDPVEIVTSPLIRKLTVLRFRGLKRFVWRPDAGVNVVLGGGDTGKTTILEAIALLLSPTNATILSDTDFWMRNTQRDFLIEAVISLPDKVISSQAKLAWPWEWDVTRAKLPQYSEAGEYLLESQKSVYRLRVRGTSDLELIYELIQPDGSRDRLSVGLRREIGIVRLTGDERNDRDLRLVQGSALDRLLAGKDLRAKFTQFFANDDINKELNTLLKEEAKDSLNTLDKTFKGKALPDSLTLGLNGGPGLSVSSLIGLRANNQGVQLPLACWGAGTRRLASLAIDDVYQNNCPITLVDEVERGLEPYRQRAVMADLGKRLSQVFLTTHSSVIVSATTGSLWHLDRKGKIGKLHGKQVEIHQKIEPETFLAKLAIVAEGITEVGFVNVLLEKTLASSLDEYGIKVAYGEGNDKSIKLLEALSKAGFSFGGFVDNEGPHSGTCKKLKEKVGALFFQWEQGCIEDNIIPLVPQDRLEEFVEDPDGYNTGQRLAQLRARLNAIGILVDTNCSFEEIKQHAGDSIVSVIVQAATGRIPKDFEMDSKTKKEWESHSKAWFKSPRGGRELAEKVFNLGILSLIETKLRPFVNAVRREVGLNSISSLS